MVTKNAQQTGVLDRLVPIEARDPKIEEPFTVLTRPQSSDAAVVKEVIEKHVYRKGFADTEFVFGVHAGERWLDLGGNIGTFSIWALRQGASVVAFEPERITFRVMQKNIGLELTRRGGPLTMAQMQRYAVTSGRFHADHSGQANLSLGHRGSEWRHTLLKEKSELLQPVETVPIALVLRSFGSFDGIKADIEGAELEMFDEAEFYAALREAKVDRFVFEYHLDIDRDCEHFHERMNRLRGHFAEVKHAPVAEHGDYEFFPPSRIVYCWGGRKESRS